MNLRFWNKKPEPKTPSFRESVIMLATVVAAVVAAATAAFKAVLLVFDIVTAAPAYIKSTFVCGKSYLATFWGFITYLPRTAWAKLRGLIPARGTATDPAAAATGSTTTTTIDPAAATA